MMKLKHCKRHINARVSSRRPISTYSIVAIDKETRELGVAVQSHWFSVGSIVSWAQAGVGAVATQSIVEPAYGPRGLELMRGGKSAGEALEELLAADNGGTARQVAMVDYRGGVSAHTGARCIAEAGHFVDEENGFSVQANMMRSDRVWGAMAKAYVSAKGDLAERLLCALDGAQSVGGDIRGKQSAAILVVSGEPTGKPWVYRVFDLRVEDHRESLAELRRLVQLQRAYLHMNAGDGAVEQGNMEEALKEYSAAVQMAPEVVEIPFWQAVALVTTGHVESALPIFCDVFAREPAWRELVPRLRDCGILPDDDGVIAKILSE